jgi:O-6-methylguanine DNA methyltransferase
MNLHLDTFASPLGDILLVCDDDHHLRALDFASEEARMRRLLDRHYGGHRLERRAAPERVRSALSRFFAGELGPIDALEVRTGGTDFERSVWAALRRIPAGTTTSYGALAEALGRPGASRAVGRANGANPVGIVVPCHRVIGADGSLTGYAGGIERKRWLLAHERSSAPASEARC